LITVDLDYKVLVAENFTESDVYPIRMLHGKTILLPNEQKYYPSRENLKWHNNKFYEQNR
jgi:putative restriction endonuclease